MNAPKTFEDTIGVIRSRK